MRPFFRILSSVVALCLMCSIPVRAQYQWVAENAFTDQTLTNVRVHDTSMAVIAGFGGTIAYSTNRGVAWTIAHTNTNANLYGITFLSDSIFFAGGNGIIIKTTDAGYTWMPTDEAGFNVRCMTTDASGVVYASGSYGGVGRVMLSKDSGITWSVTQSNAFNATLYAIVSAGAAIVTASSNGSIYSTTDQGKSFTQNSSANQWVRTAAAYGNNVVVGGNSGIFGHSEDFGNQWYFQNILNNEDIAGLSLKNHFLLAATDFGYIHTSTNDGTTWSHDYTSFPNHRRLPLHGIDFYGPSLSAIAVGDSGTILWTGPDTSRIRPTPTDTTEWRVARKFGDARHHLMQGIAMTTSGLAIGVGLGGAVERSTNAGATWQCDSIGTIDFFRSGFCSEAEWFIFSAGSRMMMHSLDSGKTWLQEVSPTTGQIWRTASNGHTLVAVGQAVTGTGVIVVHPDQFKWRTIYTARDSSLLPPMKLVTSLGGGKWLAISNSLTQYVISTDNGDSWSVVLTNDTLTRNLTCLAAFGALPMVGTENGSVMYQLFNGWGAAPISSFGITGVTSAQTTGFASDVFGSIYRCRNDMYSWSPMKTPPRMNLSDIIAADSSHAVAYGNSEDTWYYSPAAPIASVLPQRSSGHSNELSILVQPNPMHDHGSISVQTTTLRNAEITITDVLGRSILHSAISSDQISLDPWLTHMFAGRYFVHIQNGAQSASAMLIVE